MNVREVNLVLESPEVSKPREWRLDDSLVQELEELGLAVKKSDRGTCAASALARIMIKAGLESGIALVDGLPRSLGEDLKDLGFNVKRVDFTEKPLKAADEVARVVDSGDLTVISLESALAGLVVATALSAVRRLRGGKWVLERTLFTTIDPRSDKIVGLRDFLRAWVFLDALASCVGQASEVDVEDVVNSGFKVPKDVRRFIESLTLGHPGYSGSLTWEIEEDSWVPYLDLMIRKVRPDDKKIKLKTPAVVGGALRVMASLGGDRLEENEGADKSRRQ
ncbi:hypothetical protein [Methanopyrus kandleri]